MRRWSSLRFPRNLRAAGLAKISGWRCIARTRKQQLVARELIRGLGCIAMRKPPLATGLEKRPSVAGIPKQPLALGMRNCARERGNAIVEFVAVIALLLVPAIIATTALSTLLSAKNAAASAARNAARVYVRSESSPTGRTRATAIARLAFADRGINAEPRITFRCTRDPCLSPGGYVDVTMSADVALPLVDIPIAVTEVRRFPVDALRKVRQ